MVEWAQCGSSNSLTPAGVVYCWGLGDRLGDGALASSTVPRRVAGDRAYRTISAGGQRRCALTTPGLSSGIRFRRPRAAAGQGRQWSVRRPTAAGASEGQ